MSCTQNHTNGECVRSDCAPVTGTLMYKNELSDEEVLIQYIKIFLGIVIGVVVCFILLHINRNITTLIVQQREMINKK